MKLSSPNILGRLAVGSPFTSVAVSAALLPLRAADGPAVSASKPRSMLHKIVKVNDLYVFDREAGSADASTDLLLHDFLTSSRMFRNLISALVD